MTKFELTFDEPRAADVVANSAVRAGLTVAEYAAVRAAEARRQAGLGAGVAAVSAECGMAEPVLPVSPVQEMAGAQA